MTVRVWTSNRRKLRSNTKQISPRVVGNLLFEVFHLSGVVAIKGRLFAMLLCLSYY